MAPITAVQATEQQEIPEEILVPICGPDIGNVEYRTCGQYPACEGEGHEDPPAANLEEDQ